MPQTILHSLWKLYKVLSFFSCVQFIVLETVKKGKAQTDITQIPHSLVSFPGCLVSFPVRLATFPGCLVSFPVCLVSFPSLITREVLVVEVTQNRTPFLGSVVLLSERALYEATLDVFTLRLVLCRSSWRCSKAELNL